MFQTHLFLQRFIKNRTRMTHRRIDEVVQLRYNDISSIEKLKNAKTYLEKNLVLDREKKVYDFFSENQKINFLLEQLSQDEEYILKLMVLINQEHILFCQEEIDLLKKLKALSDRLLEIEKFYSPIGGIVGYHNTFMYLLKKINSKN